MSTTESAPGPATGPAAYPATPRTTPTRARERVSYDRELVHAILDEGYLCHLGFVREGEPVVLPTLYARLGERLYLHGSTGAGYLRPARDGGLPVCLTVTHVDGLVLAASAFHHSVNYRSVVVRGTARPVTAEDEKRRAFDAVVDQVIPGRSADCRPAAARELAATAILALDLAEVSAKVRRGGPKDDPEDLGLPHWRGVLPVRLAYGPPRAAEEAGDPQVPGYLTGYARP
ncbi:pyridoxamine 5'-phosphate oxidase family protein [Streptomyces hoynatensis]|uniref:Pyridoxamine 5'-phosphate oxidase family protein n=1 Tax=Streptomyces hoynatensis TaxID=1141874 RepID=A0A3A9ZBU6_9ACTN|nr:pyridoxamine 5'-phosphate oxidase family protein [Streptomyces hoynatensis]RKN44817.1 pyridoxamine 5'-phosphate oxidase family protein [Streptomyces hoynatensis]